MNVAIAILGVVDAVLIGGIVVREFQHAIFTTDLRYRLWRSEHEADELRAVIAETEAAGQPARKEAVGRYLPLDAEAGE